MLRAAALSLLMLVSVVTMLPPTDSSAHNNGRSATSGRHHRFRRHSRAWWRRYRARVRRRRAAIARRKALEAMRLQRLNTLVSADNRTTTPEPMSTLGGVYNHPRGLWSVTMPNGWSTRPMADGSDLKFRIYSPDGRAAGQATLSVVAAASEGAEPARMTLKRRASTLSGVPVTALRRTVIDQMVREGGWIVNDYTRDMGGRRVFVVQAQMPASGDGRVPAMARTYYFTEVDGRIYNLATSAPADSSRQLAAESEQVVSSFRTGNRSVQTEASLRQ